jgi:hypothetical protein
LESQDAEVEVKSAWEIIGENTNISAKENLDYYELKKYNTLFKEGC